jgi:ribosome-associated protein
MTARDQALAIAGTVVAAARDKLGQNIVVIDVAQKLGIADLFVLISASNERQLAAIVDEIERCCHLAGHPAPRREGEREGPWVLLDFFDTVVHVQHVEARVRYGLDRLWKDCPVIEVPEVHPPPAPTGDPA